MCAQTVVPPDEQEKYKVRLERRVAEERSDRERDHFVLEAGVLASLRLERVACAEAAASVENVYQQIQKYEADRKQAFSEATNGLGANPAESIRILEGTSEGCRWLAQRWREVSYCLDGSSEGRGLKAMAFEILCTLSGAPADQCRLESMWVWTWDEEPVADQRERRAHCLERAERYEAEAARLEEAERAQRERVAVIAQVEVSKDGQLRSRYLAEAQRDLRQNLNRIDREVRAHAQEAHPSNDEPEMPRVYEPPVEAENRSRPAEGTVEAENRSRPASLSPQSSATSPHKGPDPKKRRRDERKRRKAARRVARRR
jgi:hypothetical protein